MAHPSQNRPTSPHLTIYRPQITSVLSIFHRFTGIALYAGALLVTFWLFTAAYSADCFQWLHDTLNTTFGKVILFGWTLAFFYHLANGIRHLLWDTGRGFELASVSRTGWMVLIFTVVMSVLTWWLALAGNV